MTQEKCGSKEGNTPRTDEAIKLWLASGGAVIAYPAETMRALERELAEALRSLSDTRTELAEANVCERENFRRAEENLARAEAMRVYAVQLREALEKIAKGPNTDTTGAVGVVMRDIARAALSKCGAESGEADDGHGVRTGPGGAGCVPEIGVHANCPLCGKKAGGGHLYTCGLWTPST